MNTPAIFVTSSSVDDSEFACIGRQWWGATSHWWRWW